MKTSPLRLWFFGAFAAEFDGEPLHPPRWRKSLWLLALLALRQGREVPRAWLAETLWPDSELNKALFNLRQALAQDLRPSLGSGSALLRAPTPSTLCLDPDDVWSDVSAFDAEIAGGSSLEQAVALYRGPLLEGCTEEWALQERTSREEAFHAALETLASEAMTRQDPAAAVGYLRRCIASAPLQENAHMELMQALSASGDQAGVTQAYRNLRLLLHRELNAEPAARTRTLYERLLQEARQPRLSASDLPASSVTSAPRRLPVPLTRLIGRERDIAEVVDRFAQGRMVTLVGVGGVGKTRLSIAVAEAMAKGFPDGVWFVDLAALENPGLAAVAVAQVFQVREQPGQTIEETLAAALAARSLLVVLDNCEHLLDACARLAEGLLSRCPGLRVLATSRQALGLNGEWIYQVPSLETPRLPPAQARSDVEKNAAYHLLEYDAVRLFVERAAAQRERFKPTALQVLAIAEICERLDGIPLAIELAAARVKMLSVAQIAERLESCFSLLTGGSRTALPRQQTLMATLDWSWKLLSLQEQILLGRLAVFAGGWALEAAEALSKAESGRRKDESIPDASCIEDWEVLDLLSSLVDKSLVIAEMQGEVIRYRLLETVRQYAWYRLADSGESNLVQGRHWDYFLALAEEAAPELKGTNQVVWTQRLEVENENLRAALERSLGEGESGVGLRLCGALQRYWSTRGHLSEGREWCERALSEASAQERTPERAKALNGAGTLAWMQGDYASARAFQEESLSLWRERGDRGGIAASLNGLGNVSHYQGDYTSALAYYEQSLDIKREMGDRSGIASSLNNLGLVAHNQGDNASARTYYEQSLNLFREIGDWSGIAVLLNALGNVAYHQGDNASARTYFEQSLSLQREMGNRGGIALSLHNLGNVAHCQGDYPSALAYYEQSLDIKREMGDRGGIAASLNDLGNVAYHQGDNASALAYYEQSLVLFREIEDRSGIAASLNGLGSVAYHQGDYPSARTYFEQCLSLQREIGNRTGISRALNNLGNVAHCQGDYASARAYQEESLSLFREIGDRMGIVFSLEAFASLLAAQEQSRQAARLWGAAEALREDIGIPLSPSEREEYDRIVVDTRAALGKETFSVEWAKGRAMTWEQAAAYALTTSWHDLDQNTCE